MSRKATLRLIERTGLLAWAGASFRMLRENRAYDSNFLILISLVGSLAFMAPEMFVELGKFTERCAERFEQWIYRGTEVEHRACAPKETK